MSGPEQRTEAGALLRSGLEILSQNTLPDGVNGQVVVVTDMKDAYVGAAWRTKQGWTVDVGVSAAVRGGRQVKIAGAIRW